jgi:protein-tyrosine phosphatase
MSSPQQFVNFRDLGGLRMTGGSVTQSGILYRSDAPYPGDTAPQSAPAWPPATVIDLRSAGEVQACHYRWPDQVAVHHVPLLRQAAIVAGTPEGAARAARDLPTSLDELYRSMMDRLPERLASLIAIAARRDRPVLVHCMAGKDRTGVAIAVLLLAGNVEPADVVADYTATAANMSALFRRLASLGLHSRVNPETDAGILGAPAQAITLVIEHLLKWPGGPQAWAESHGSRAEDVERWRARLAHGTDGDR